ncbi:MAG: hypothetical protein WA936_05095 [Erythrobacter sp.]|uniref:hypothetical protein n=1 Tax=Erythrobacter sp. TaxID=1042 RepID=UPI003C749CC9
MTLLPLPRTPSRVAVPFLLQISRRAGLLAGATALAVPAASSAQEPPVVDPPAIEEPQPQGEAADVQSQNEIVISAPRRRGQLDVEQAPLLELNEEDIAAQGVTSIEDLITQITNQTGSARGRGGGRPVILINGIRVGSFREFRNYPPEAVERVEVFPEEVAQRFGFAPDRRVINLILKENFRNAEVELEFEGPARGGYHQREQELGFLQIADGARINVNLEASDASLLTEDERDIIQTPGSISDVPGDPDQAPFRSLVPDSRSLEANVSWAKALIDSGISLSASASYDREDRRSLQGLNTVLLSDGDTSVLRTFGADTPLEQRTASDSFATSGSLTTAVNEFQLTSTFDASLTETEQEVDRRFDTDDFIEEALGGALSLDAALPGAVDAGFDTANTRSVAFSTLSTMRGPLVYLPGGEVTATFDIGYDWTNLQSEDTRGGLPVDLTRGELSTGVNLVVPITSRREGFADALGSVSLNAQLGLQHLSDFGTLGDYTLGLNWEPFDNLDLSATYIQREVAPGLSALGDPTIELPNVPVFDFVNGETVLATVVTGGNPDLLAETQRDWKFAANWELPFWENTRFTLEYNTNRSDDVTSGFPQVTPEIEAAFPGRTTRGPDGRLERIDRRAVTFAETRSSRLQFGLSTRGSFGEDEEEAGSERGDRGERGNRGGGRDRDGAREDRAAPSERGGAPTAEQRAAFREFRTRICADDGLAVLTRLIEAAESGEDLSATIPGFDAQRFERLLAQVRGEDGEIDPARIASLREGICAFDPGALGADSGEPGTADRPGFAAIREIACGEDGVARLRDLIAKIDAGEDVSDSLPGLDPRMAQMMLGRLRDADGNISAERLEQLRSRLCSDTGEGGDARGGSPGGGGFNPLERRSFSGFRYFVSLNHTIELENEILIAPGLDPLDQLDGDATSSFGFPRNTSRLEAGVFGQGIGTRFSASYTGKTRLDGSGLPGSSDLFFGDIARFDLRVFSEIGELIGSDAEWLEDLRLSFRVDNVFDARRRVVDDSGETPLNYQPFLIDPVGRFVGVDIRKLF